MKLVLETRDGKEIEFCMNLRHEDDDPNLDEVYTALLVTDRRDPEYIGEFGSVDLNELQSFSKALHLFVSSFKIGREE